MIKVFLVEDEMIALQALECKVTRLGAPYKVIGTAINGIDALEQLQDLSPDILIADICMPEMDGIALLERLSTDRPEIITVILSGYQEFEYAKQAMRFGTKDYLLKPISVEDLQNCLDDCRKRLEQRKNQNLVSLLIGENTYSFSTDHTTDKFAAAYLILSNALSTLNSITHPDVPYITSKSLEEYLCGLLPDSLEVHCFDGIFSNEKALIFSGAHLSETRLLQLLTGILPKLEAFCQNYLTMYFSCVENAASLNKVVFSARSEAVRCIILGRTQLCSKPADKETRWPGLQSQAELFLLLLNQNQLSSLHSHILQLFHEWAAANRTAMSIQNDLQFLLEYFRHNGSCDPSLSSVFLAENLLCFYQDEETFAESFYQLLFHFSSSGQSSDFRSASELVKDIDRYLQEHLSRPLSLQVLSDEFNVSKVYLCRIFKKYKNMTPIDYFNRLKISRAKLLLVQFPDMPLREIAALLGFNDMYYFSKVFKKITGKSPSEIRSESSAD
jgi:two-component system response regulator YesN